MTTSRQAASASQPGQPSPSCRLAAQRRSRRRCAQPASRHLSASRFWARRPLSRVVYLTAEYFMWRFATAIRDNNALTFKEQLRDIDLLIIDDMQFLQ